MVIQEMTPDECREFLGQTSLARLACGMDDQPYVVPVYLVYDGACLFGFATMGQKIDCMRTNPLVCVEIDDIKTHDEWKCVVAFGSYEELPDTPEHRVTRDHAQELLLKREKWWEPASAAIEPREFPKLIAPIFYRIQVDRMTGRRASPDADLRPVRVKAKNWWRRLLDRMLPPPAV